jgi:hypothetical protein
VKDVDAIYAAALLRLILEVRADHHRVRSKQ